MNIWLDAVVRRVQYMLVIEWDEWPEYLAVRGLSFEETIVHWGLEHSRVDEVETQSQAPIDQRDEARLE